MQLKRTIICFLLILLLAISSKVLFAAQSEKGCIVGHGGKSGGQVGWSCRVGISALIVLLVQNAMGIQDG